MPPCHGVDTSNNQGAAVVGIGPQLKAMGVEGWWHKATQSDTFRDRYWPACRQARIDNGLRYGGPYHWLQPHHDVGSQFRWFEGYVGDLLPGESIQLDIEDPAGLSDDVVFDAVDRWEGRWPGRVLVYTGRWYMPYNPTGRRVESYLIDRLIARYGAELRWWLPWYASTFPGAQLPTTPVMWQWAGGAGGIAVEGVGRIDSNQIIDRARLETLCGYGALQPDVDPPVPPPQEEDDMSPEQAQMLAEVHEALLGRGPSLDPSAEQLPMDRRWTQHYTYVLAQDITNQLRALEAKVDDIANASPGDTPHGTYPATVTFQ